LCWSKEASDRPNFNYIIEELTKEVGFYKTAINLEEMLIMEKSSVSVEN
jgi:hypothetical protein